MHWDVISEISDRDLCVGCGVCAGVCPSEILKMTEIENGDRIPVKSGDCQHKCDLCLKVCPFNDSSHNEDTISEERFETVPGVQYHGAVGNYLSAYVGYSMIADQRIHGASGGMCTWMLEALLDAKEVDLVACVGQGEEGESLFAYHISEDNKEVRNKAGSRYYPVDIADLVRRLNAPGPDQRYAIVGLPCTLKGLRLTMMHLPKVRRRVVFLLGLVCGHLPNRYYTEYLARLSGFTPEELKAADYRLKKANRAGNFYFQAHSRTGSHGQLVPFLGQVSHAWNTGYFQCNACNYCDDIFAEVSDAVFMDAWLPEYEVDPRGTSLIVARHPKLRELLERGIKDETCCLDTIPIERVVSSQEVLIHKKKIEIGGRLFLAQRSGMHVPKKRIAPSEDIWRQHRQEIKTQYAVQCTSKLLWPKLRKSPLWHFHLQMLRVDWPLRVALWRKRTKRLIANPRLLLRFFPRCLLGRHPKSWQKFAPEADKGKKK